MFRVKFLYFLCTHLHSPMKDQREKFLYFFYDEDNAYDAEMRRKHDTRVFCPGAMSK